MRCSQIAVVLCLSLGFLVAGCSSEPDEAVAPEETDAPRLIGSSGELAIEIVIPEGTGLGLTSAAEDMAEVFQRLTDAAQPATVREGGLEAATTKAVVLVEVSEELDSGLGEQSYTLVSGPLGSGKRGIHVQARTQVGAMYGLYHVVADLGVRYHHPEETFFPSAPEATLPWEYEGAAQTPHYERRGFHEHTQHPTVMSDFFLRPEAEFRPYVSRYIRWFARNRQNEMSWHMLKTVDIPAWLPYITEVVSEAREYGISAGMVLSFVDQQQNNFKIVEEERLDPATGAPVDSILQIETTLDTLAGAGFDFFTFQIGSSEFTKPDEQEMLSWLNYASNRMAERERPVRTYAWIHTTCSLKAEDGDYYYHLPKHADPVLGSWVHTTMFYPLDLPAPVYDCEDFSHHLDFLDTEHQQREQIYFPESAWWLGFDNNTPLALPITGWSREHDIRVTLAPYDVNGHVTFTTGREWNYWHYDHFLMQSTWDADVTWSDYLKWISGMYGEHGDLLVEVLDEWTELQRRHFYDENPLIFFYVAGELRQDEIGEQAGIAARRPKVSYRSIAAMNSRDFNAWKANDFDMLVRMRDEFAPLLERLPASQAGSDTLEAALYHEAYTTLELYVMRLDHVIELYSAVILVRDYVIERRRAGDDPVEAELRAGLLGGALAHLDAARQISARVIEIVAEMEPQYRYSVELLARPKPETLTSYPFGYLWETSTGHFWTRRDDQLEGAIATFFETIPEEWTTDPEELFHTDNARTELLTPEDELVASVLTSFLPQFLFGLTGFADDEAADQVSLAQDYNQNLLPDPDTEAIFVGVRDALEWRGELETYAVIVYDDSGLSIGELVLLDSVFEIAFTEELVPTTATVTSQIGGRDLVQMVVNVGGIDFDGAANLVKAVFDVPASEPLPERLDVAFRFHLVR